MTIYMLLYLVVIVVPAGTLVHELGHGIAAYMAKAEHIALHIGTGKRVKTWTYKRFTIFLYGIFFIGGISESKRSPPYNAKEKIWIASGGPAGNAVIICILIAIFGIEHHPYIRLFILFQCWLMFINILPFQWKGKQSDGYTIMQTIRKDVYGSDK